MNVVEMIMDKILIGRKIKKVKAQYVKELTAADQNNVIELEEIKMHQHMEEQLVMAPGSETLIYFYNEAII